MTHNHSDLHLAKTLGAAITTRRQHLNMLQREVAEKAGLQLSAYTRIELGYHLPKITTLRATATALGWTLKDLFTHTEKEQDDE